MHNKSLLIALRALTVAAAVLPCITVSAADAPPAPAATYRGYSGVHWASDFQVRKGHCDRGHIAQSPKHSDAMASLGQLRAPNRGAAMLIGARVPELLPDKLGADADEVDRACMGQVLELGASGKWVKWDNDATGIHFEMRPDAGRDGIAGSCRAFRLKATGNDQNAKLKAMACETGPGLWQLTGL
jgi:hypothetical protein